MHYPGWATCTQTAARRQPGRPMEHDAQYAIELGDAHVRLRPWSDADADALVDAVRESVDSVGRWLPWCRADYGRDAADAWIAHCQAGWQAGNHFAFAVRRDRKSTRLNSSHSCASRMPSSA